MTAPDVLERLATVRPDMAARTTEVLGGAERAQLCTSIMSSPARLRQGRVPTIARRRPAWVLLGAAMAAVVVAVAAVLAVIVIPDHAAPDASAAVVAKATAAIAGHTDGVIAIHAVNYGPKGTIPVVSDSWSDPRDAHHFRIQFDNPAAQPYETGQYVENGQVMSISLNAVQRIADVQPMPKTRLGVLGGPSTTQIRAMLRSKTVAVDGHQMVGGIDALHLVDHPAKGVRVDLWIDPATYLVVRSQMVRHSSLTATDFRVVSDIRWLPPTPANLALLDVAIPPGYRTILSPPLPVRAHAAARS